MGRFAERARRARELKDRYPVAVEALEFFARLSEFQDQTDRSPSKLRALLDQIGPAPLRGLAVTAEQIESYWREPDPSTPRSLIARVLLESDLPATQAADGPCPKCGHPPQLGILRPLGDGTQLSLACSLCRTEWITSRTLCPVCGKDAVALAGAEGYPHIRTQTCESCMTYFHVIDLSREPVAIPEADELAAQPLDVWAIEQGFTKIYPSWIGL